MAAVTAPAVRPADLAQRKVAAGLWENAWYRLRRDRLTIASAVILFTLVILSVSAPLLGERVFNTNEFSQDLLKTYRQPTLDPPKYLFGSDELGRSQVLRLLYGGQVSLFIGTSSAVRHSRCGSASSSPPRARSARRRRGS